MAGVEYVISLRDKFSPVMARARSGFEKIDRSVRTLNNSISGTSLALAGMAIGFGAIKVLKLAGEFEQTQVAFETMLGSAEKGQEVLGKLAEFATKTPFSIKGVEDNAKLLLAVGVEVDKLLPTMKSLGDVSAGLNVPLNRLALNFGQVKSQGKLTGRELRDFAIAGVPIIAELSKNLGVNTATITKMVSAGSIGFNEVAKAFETMSGKGGKFFNLMDKQNKTFLGGVNELRENFQLLGRQIGQVLIPIIEPLIRLTSRLVSWFKRNESATRIFTKVIAGIVIGMGALIIVTKAYGVILAITAFLDPFRLMIISIAVLIGIFVVFKSEIRDFLDVMSSGFNFRIAQVKNQFLGLIESIHLTWLHFSKSVNETLRNLSQVEKIQSKIESILKKNSGRGKEVERLRKENLRLAIKAAMNFGGLSKVNETAADIVKGFGIDVASGELSLSNQTTVTSAAPKVFNINIDKLVEKFTVETTNIQEGTDRIKELITTALMEGVADFQTR